MCTLIAFHRVWKDAPIVVELLIAYVQGYLAAGPLLVHDDGDGAPFNAFAKGDPAPAGEPCVRESLQHGGIILPGRKTPNCQIPTVKTNTVWDWDLGF